MNETNALRDLAQAELARRRLLDFGRRLYPGFETPPHIVLLADLLERVERGELRRLMVNLPVRHGKSVLCSQLFPAWTLGRDSNREVIIASHSEDLSVRHSRVGKGLVEDERWPFPGVTISRTSASVQRWDIDGARGGMYAIGVGGAITGRGADFLLVDDALHDGLSESDCDRAFAWYSEVAAPRLNPGGAIVMVGARFHTRDLCGQILASEDGTNWHVVNIPAIALENDVLGRFKGEALWPDRMDERELELRRLTMGEAAFLAQFQQRPVARGAGGYVQGQWLRLVDAPSSGPKVRRVYDPLVTAGLRRPSYERVEDDDCVRLVTIDAGWTGSVGTSETALVAMQLTGDHDLCVTVSDAFKLDLGPAWMRVKALVDQQKPDAVAIENSSPLGGALLVRLSDYLGPGRVIALEAKRSKEDRALDCVPWLERFGVEIVRGPSSDKLQRQLLDFPSEPNDLADALFWAVLTISQVRSARIAEQRFRAQLRKIPAMFQR